MLVPDRHMYIFLLLNIIIFFGMIYASWRFILYTYLWVIGLAILWGMWKQVQQTSVNTGIPILVTVMYFILYGGLDLITRVAISGGNLLYFGLTPSIALYLFGIFPFGVIVCLLYVVTYIHDESLEKKDTNRLDKEVK